VSVVVTNNVTSVVVTPETPTPVTISGASEINVVGIIGGITLTGDATKPNIINNSETNSIEGASTDAGVWGNTIAGGGNPAQPNQMFGNASLTAGTGGIVRTISGGYDNIIGRPYITDQLDSGLASTISGGAHNRIRRPLTVNDKAGLNIVDIPTESPSGNYPNHSFIGGGGYHYIHNGIDNVIVGGFGNAIFASVIIGGTNQALYDGNKAVIVGGYSNAVGATYGFIGGGETNKVLGHHGSIVGGANNTISKGSAEGSGASAGYSNEGYSFIGGGSSNTINKSQYATIASGANNTIGNAASDYGSYCSVIGGYQNEAGTSAYGWGATVLGGWQNKSLAFCSLTSGRHAKALHAYQHAHGHERFSVDGDCQTSVFVLKAQTPDATPTTMMASGAGVSVPSNGIWAFRALVTARQDSSTTAAAWIIQGAARNDSGTTSVMGTPTVTSLGTNGSPIWSVAVDASGSNLRIRVTGAASTVVRWVARMDTSEVI